MPWTRLCQLDELKEGQGLFVELAGRQVAVFLHVGKPYVIDNYCPHAGGNLSGGRIESGCVVCPWHEWEFRLDNGCLRDSPMVRVQTYSIRIVTSDENVEAVEIELPD